MRKQVLFGRVRENDVIGRVGPDFLDLVGVARCDEENVVGYAEVFFR